MAAWPAKSSGVLAWILLTIFFPSPFPANVAVEVLQSAGEPDPLDMRAREVGEALQRARELLGDLQTEVSARAAIIESLAARTTEAEQRAAEASARAGLTEKESEAVDALW